MNEEHLSTADKGLPIGLTAPSIETKDIYNSEIILNRLYSNFNGILIDFFRGAW